MIAENNNKKKNKLQSSSPSLGGAWFSRPYSIAQHCDAGAWWKVGASLRTKTSRVPSGWGISCGEKGFREVFTVGGLALSPLLLIGFISSSGVPCGHCMYEQYMEGYLAQSLSRKSFSKGVTSKQRMEGDIRTRCEEGKIALGRRKNMQRPSKSRYGFRNCK